MDSILSFLPKTYNTLEVDAFTVIQTFCWFIAAAVSFYFSMGNARIWTSIAIGFFLVFWSLAYQLNPFAQSYYKLTAIHYIIGTIAILLISHDGEDVAALADAVGVLHAGRRVAEGSPDALAKRAFGARQELVVRLGVRSAPAEPILTGQGLTAHGAAALDDGLTWAGLVEDAPARALHLSGGHLSPGAPADITVLDLKARHTVEHFASKSQNSPFIGWTLQGKAAATLVGGHLVMRGGRLLKKPDLH